MWDGPPDIPVGVSGRGHHYLKIPDIDTWVERGHNNKVSECIAELNDDLNNSNKRREWQ